MVRGVHRPTVATIDLGAIKENIQQIRRQIQPHKKLLAVVKADGYGHGAVPVANAAKEAGVDGFCVAILDEALELRESGFTEDFLLVMGLTEVRDVALMADQNISVTVSSLDWLEDALPLLALRKTNRPLRIHLAVDTGMGRIGLRTKEEIQRFEAFCSEQEELHFEGIFTHFATADGEDNDQVERQYAMFKEIVQGLKERPEIVHLANSAMTLWHEDFETDAVRIGIAMYGYNPSDQTLQVPYPLKPAFTLRTELSYVKQMRAGDTISYGARYRAYEGEWLATLPIGYADGLRRDLGGQTFLVEGHRCPVRGVICMDQCMISLPHAFPIGTKVTILGEDHGEVNSPSAMAVEIGTIGYEILCGISQRVPRVYIDSRNDES
ncbi:alanine racemase [Jeotgalibaca caeni]|uniref:alanine racemase n=1 Tax=Jeotgalibaca caeni TaxID=3028623 RepID=UPI00237E3D3B|nr:alanine racemase [Jeotgalibaca caeni]MDE1548479.1 alanine racemase [Jeotgalibaca caeni]